MKKIKWFTFLNNFILFAPIAFMIRSNKGLSGSEIFILQAVLAICIVLLEVPSGYLADRLGYKRTIILAQIALLISRSIFYFGYGFEMLIWDVIFLGISTVLLSGVIEAYLYETSQESYNNEISKIYNFSTFGFIGSNLLFTILILFNENWLIGGTLLANILALFIALQLPSVSTEKPTPAHAPKHISDFRIAFQYKKFWLLSFLNATIGVGMVVFNLLFIMLLTQEGFPEALFGGVILLYAAFELVVKYTDAISIRFGKENFLAAIFLGIGMIYIGISTLNSIPVLVLLGGAVMPLLIALSILISEMNNQFVDSIEQSHHRVTLLSLFNVTGRLFEVIFFFAIAIGFASFNIIFLCMGLVYLAALVAVRLFLYTAESSAHQ